MSSLKMSSKNKGADSANGTLERSSKNHPCYFCNESFELGQLQNHLTQCGSILEQCPLRCGAWIQRKHKERHTEECPRKTSSSPTHARPQDVATPLPTAGHTWTPSAPLEDCVTFLEKEVAVIKLILTEEVNQRDVQASDLDALRSKFVLLEDKTQHFLNNLMTLRTALDDEAERTSNWAAQVKHDLASVQLGLQELQSQQLSTAMRLESAVNSIVHEQYERELLEKALNQQDTRTRNVRKLEEVIEYIKQTLEDERQRNSESRAMLESELMEARRSSEQLSQLATVRLQLQGAAAEQPAVDRLAVLELATAEARAEYSEQATRMDILAKDVRALTKSYLKMRSELADFQSRISFDNPEMGGDNGHLVWRIDQFAARMKQAKEADTVLSSPLFRTSKYGYTLKAELNLNGIGKWKGRHMTSTVRLVSGPYDPILQWPCQLSVNIVLKDQPTDRHQSMDIVKSLELRRKSSSKRHDYDDPGEKVDQTDKSVLQMKRQYIFIPHTSLDKFDYIKNDVMFLEFIIKQ